MRVSLLLVMGLVALLSPARGMDEHLVHDFAALVAGIKKADGAAPFIAFAELNGANQVPAPVKTNATALFWVAVGKSSLAWALDVEDIKDFTMSHIHQGNDSTNGPPVVILGPAQAVNATGLPMFSPSISGSFSMKFQIASNSSNILGVTPPNLQKLITSGDAYVNVHTVAAPSGLIRGQLDESSLD